ncbi:hypothetical protein MMUR_23750 [Mycolicibacterium murale]|uniref:Uncharacterized protein n=1 Tax=Mycolicibacterium murale TaxID=182220 RepID=A0A7I9WKV0_9MYCO|nr:hypothetical protein [Mycolicibacterium murale]MCV7185429.1 hypothetical protein [Mycolicibacterium murale]GFG58239.1 hypothetical protein MMUR_23750 [Mycolicibacterium murale]
MRSVAADSVRTSKAVERVAANIVKILKTNNGALARTALRRKIAMRDREYFEDAESLLFDRRQVDKAPSGNSGPEGFVLRLTDAESSK